METPDVDILSFRATSAAGKPKTAEQGMTYLAEADRESSLPPLQAASCTYRVAPGHELGRKC